MYHDTAETRRKENRRGTVIAIGFVAFLIALNFLIRAIG